MYNKKKKIVRNCPLNVYMDGVVQDVNVKVLGKGLELLSANRVKFVINRLLFADDPALAADSEEKLCGLVGEFGRVCEKRKLRVNIDKSKVMRCLRYGNMGQICVILNSKPLVEVDCFLYLGLQVAADGGSQWDMAHRMNEGYLAWGALKSVLIKRGLGIKEKKSAYEGIIVEWHYPDQRHGV